MQAIFFDFAEQCRDYHGSIGFMSISPMLKRSVLGPGGIMKVGNMSYREGYWKAPAHPGASPVFNSGYWRVPACSGAGPVFNTGSRRGPVRTTRPTRTTSLLYQIAYGVA